MRKLIVGSIIGVSIACAALAEDNVKTGPGTTILQSGAASRGDDAFNQRHIATEMEDLTVRLELTPQQQVAVKAAMEAVVHGTATKTVEQVLREICSDKQFAAWEQVKSDSRAESAAMAASFESNGLAHLLGLDAARQKQVFAALYPVELKSQTTIASVKSSADFLAYKAAKMREMEAALGTILTPAQLVAYRLDNERRLEASEVIMGNLSRSLAAKPPAASKAVADAKLPTFSLTGYVDP